MNPSVTDADNPLPFEDLFLPLVTTAREQLRQRVSPVAYGLLTAKAHAGWERFLLARLTQTGAMAANWQFQIHAVVSGAFPKGMPEQNDRRDHLYRAFVGERVQDRLRKLWKEFPALLDLCEALVKNWLSTVSEFILRLNSDYPHFGQRFGGGMDFGRVDAIQAGLSDPHQGGHCVTRTDFTSGRTLIYKPRSVAPEDFFSRVIEWINSQDVSHPLKSAECWDCGDYGWMEEITFYPCSTLAEVRAFYWRTGALLGLIYIFQGVDIHRENLVAFGEFPVLVDLETLWHPQQSLDAPSSRENTSVLQTGFLPRHDMEGGRAYNAGALCREAFVARPILRWENVASDDIHCSVQTERDENPSHLPQFDGTARPAGNFVNEILAGFRWVGNLLLTDDESQGAIFHWQTELAKTVRRQILRSSAWYQSVLQGITSPLSLRGKISAHEIWSAIAPALEPLLPEEVRALENLDIPYFAQGQGAVEPHQLANRWLPTKQQFMAQTVVISESLMR